MTLPLLVGCRRLRMNASPSLTGTTGAFSIARRQRISSLIAFRRSAISANGGEDSERLSIHPVIRAILLHFWLAYDHPFEDGNGRTARALFYWYMQDSRIIGLR